MTARLNHSRCVHKPRPVERLTVWAVVLCVCAGFWTLVGAIVLVAT